MSEFSSSPFTWSSGDDIRNVDPESEIACFSGRLEVLDFDPFRVDFVLTPKDLEIIRIKYQALVEFRLKVAILEE